MVLLLSGKYCEFFSFQLSQMQKHTAHTATTTTIRNIPETHRALEESRTLKKYLLNCRVVQSD